MLQCTEAQDREERKRTELERQCYGWQGRKKEDLKLNEARNKWLKHYGRGSLCT